MRATGEEALLLLDTCGERASLALVRDGQLAAETVLAERTASGALLGAVREALVRAEMTLEQLSGIGAVNGPGSFTGVRVGIAMAKGLCEALQIPMAAVSRLAVLAEAAGLADGLAVLGAGRSQVYVREVRPGMAAPEWMMPATGLREAVEAGEIVYTEDAVTPLLADLPRCRAVSLTALSCLRAVQRCLAEGGSDPAIVDANYVRNEDAIYARQQQQR